MSVATKASLKALFDDGDVTSETAHHNLIDSMFVLDEEESVTVRGGDGDGSYVLLVAERPITLTYFLGSTDFIAGTHIFKLQRNRTGSITDLTIELDEGDLYDTSVDETTSPASENILDTIINTGDVVFVEYSGSTTAIELTLRYK